MFIKNAWYVAAWAADLTTTPVARRICDVPLVLYRTEAGEPAALLDRCCHRAAPLSLGRVTCAGLECGYHGLVFDTKGTCVHIPGQRHIPHTAKVASYQMVEKDAIIWIWMGDAEAADPELIVDYPFHNDPVNWPFMHETMPIKANYMLMVDNLMDLTHLGYVHVTTIGGNPTVHIDAKMETERTERGLHFKRWILDADVPPTIAAAVRFKGKADRWQDFDYIAPGVIKHWAGAVDANTGAYDQDKRDGGFAVRIFHGITPETETSCFYFWSIANGYGQDDPATTVESHRSAKEAFSEDKVVIEQQQQRLTEMGEGDLIDIRSDSARVSMRRTINRLLSKETSA
jgi:phenylpropionate dioxygenase-like ring-hydroxylating dioxygenase large terminal subunit